MKPEEVINGFINSIYLSDDQLIVVYNLTDKKEELYSSTLFLGSDDPTLGGDDGN